jgi:alpha-galactosidase
MCIEIAANSTSEEMAAANRWITENFVTGVGVPPFSFKYGDQHSSDWLKTWKIEHNPKKLDENRTEQTITFTDPDIGLKVRAEAIVYSDFPALEWVLHFKNTGVSDTPILENILPLDTRMSVYDSNPILHYSKGALCCIDDFAPVEEILEPKAQVHLQPGGGRSSSEVTPFFNIESGSEGVVLGESGSEGVVLGIGWTGEWAADVSRDDENHLQLQAGMALTHLKLYPAEEIRTPRILMLFWQGDRIRGNNMLRRFILKYHRPKPNGKPLTLPILESSWGGTAATEHLKNIKRIIEHALPIECYWIDAEWFGQGSWWNQAGNWQVKKELYPQGFEPISEMLHQSGRQLLLWFEPQRVCKNTSWYEFNEREDWLLALGNGEDSYKQWKTGGWPIPHEDPRWRIYESRRSQMNPDELLFNLGNPEARQFLTDFISARIEEFGLDWYREDANIAPLEYWRHADTHPCPSKGGDDRQGITEIRYVEGLYAFWDELLQRHPHLMIDNCASGGRRIDLESISRSTALHRTDWARDNIHVQCHSYGLFHWVPLHTSALGIRKTSEYDIRSSMAAGLKVKLGQDDSVSAQEAKRLLEQYIKIRKFYHGDYYTLTPYSQDNTVWLAWQFDCPEDGEGMIQAFRREESVYESAQFKLRGLSPDANYTVRNIDVCGSEDITGRVLMEKGLVVSIPDRPGAVVITYKKK